MSNTSVKLSRQMPLNKELNEHAAAADIFASQGKGDFAVAEFKAAVACWSMAKDVKGER